MSALDRLKLLGDRADDLTRYQAEAEAQLETEAREHRQATETRQVTALRAEIVELRASLAERDQQLLDILDQLATGLNKVEAWVNKAIEARVTRSEADMCGKISESFGELMGRISAIDPAEARTARGEPFRFASEKTDDNGDVSTSCQIRCHPAAQ